MVRIARESDDRGARGLDGVDDEAHVAVLDHVDDVRPALGDLVHRRDRDAVRRQHRRGAARGEQREAELDQVARDLPPPRACRRRAR